jgi:hypothetical protein
VEIVPFGGEHVAGAAALLATRHQRHRAAEPLLAPLRDARAEVEAAGTSGAAAVEGGEVLGYVMGDVGDERLWGRHVRVGHGGWAARDPELVRDLYAHAAARWVGAGARVHSASSSTPGSASASGTCRRTRCGRAAASRDPCRRA